MSELESRLFGSAAGHAASAPMTDDELRMIAVGLEHNPAVWVTIAPARLLAMLAAVEVMEAEQAWARAWHGKRKPNLKDGDKAQAAAAYDDATKRIAQARAAWRAQLPATEPVYGIPNDHIGEIE